MFSILHHSNKNENNKKYVGRDELDVEGSGVRCVELDEKELMSLNPCQHLLRDEWVGDVTW